MWNSRTAFEIATIAPTPCMNVAVDEAKRPEQVAVVVVARRDEGRSRSVRRDRSVDVRMHHVRVQQVRAAHDAARAANEPASRGETS